METPPVTTPTPPAPLVVAAVPTATPTVPTEKPKKTPFKCSKCKQSFCDRENRKKHEQGHGDKYPCPVCPTGFKKPEGLRKHKIEAHRDEIPCYKCKVCGLGFAHQNSVWRHNRKVHTPAGTTPTKATNNNNNQTVASPQLVQSAVTTPSNGYLGAEVLSGDSNSVPEPFNYKEAAEFVQQLQLQQQQQQQQQQQLTEPEDAITSWMKTMKEEEERNGGGGGGFEYTGPNFIPVKVFKMEEY